MAKCEHFQIYELVCPHIYEEYGEKAWNFIPNWMAETLEQLREHFNAPITVNNYHWNNGTLSQRGIRCIKCRLVQDRLNKGNTYASPHYTFQALDINVKGLTAKEVYQSILDNQEKFPHIKRIENIKYTPTWTHIDNRETGKKSIHIFNP